jgi:hypothetical protein
MPWTNHFNILVCPPLPPPPPNSDIYKPKKVKSTATDNITRTEHPLQAHTTLTHVDWYRWSVDSKMANYLKEETAWEQLR